MAWSDQSNQIYVYNAHNPVGGRALRIRWESWHRSFRPPSCAFADKRGFLIMSLSQCRSGPTWNLHYTTINNIMCAVKTLYLGKSFGWEGNQEERRKGRGWKERESGHSFPHSLLRIDAITRTSQAAAGDFVGCICRWLSKRDILRLIQCRSVTKTDLWRWHHHFSKQIAAFV